MSRSANDVLQRENLLGPAIRQRIETAVLELFSENDYHKVNMRAISKETGISLRTIYKYYGSKEELLFSIIDDWVTKLAERLIDHLQGIEDTKEKLRKVCWVVLEFYERNHQAGRIFFITGPLKTWMSDKTYAQKKLTDIFIDVLREGQEKGYLNSTVRAGLLMDVIWGLLIRSFTMWIYRGQKESLTSMTNAIFEMIWRAISNPERELT